MEQIDSIIIKYLSASTTVEEEAQLLAWLENNLENQKYFRSLKDAYDLGQVEQLFETSRPNEQWIDFKQKINSASKYFRMRKLVVEMTRYAAVLIVGIICYQTLLHLFKSEELFSETQIETGVGERAQILLPDSSRVWINSCSELSYSNSFGKKERSVYMKGEAYFEVHSNKEKPFLVHNEMFTYRVTGTSFNVSAFHDENQTSIALLEGGVVIEFGKTKEKIYPGEQFVFNKSTGKYWREKIDVNRLKLWRTGDITFENITFDELTRKLERSFNVSFVFQNEELKKETFSGSFHNYDPMETILEVLKVSTPKSQLQCTQVNDTIYIK